MIVTRLVAAVLTVAVVVVHPADGDGFGGFEPTTALTTRECIARVVLMICVVEVSAQVHPIGDVINSNNI